MRSSNLTGTMLLVRFLFVGSCISVIAALANVLGGQVWLVALMGILLPYVWGWGFRVNEAWFLVTAFPLGMVSVLVHGPYGFLLGLFAILLGVLASQSLIVTTKQVVSS